MKLLTTLATLSAVAPCYLHGQAQEDYLNWVRQIQTEQTESGEFIEIVQDNHVAPKGSDQSPLGIPLGGSLFQLWTLDTTSQQSWLLDTATVGVNRPQAQIVIEAPDSHAGVPRTRADIPFSVTTSYFGLQAPREGVPVALTQVNSKHLTEASHFPIGQFELITKERVTENRSDTQAGIFTSITPEGSQPSYKVKGTEHFTVEMVSDSAEGNIIANAQIEVFPLSTGALYNLPERDTISSLPEYIGVQVDDAYPGSEVILQATITTPSEDPNGEPTVKVVDLLNRNINNIDSEDINVQFSEYDRFPLTSGDEFTLRIIVSSPIDDLVVSEETRIFDTSISIRGSINTLD